MVHFEHWKFSSLQLHVTLPGAFPNEFPFLRVEPGGAVVSFTAEVAPWTLLRQLQTQLTGQTYLRWDCFIPAAPRGAAWLGSLPGRRQQVARLTKIKGGGPSGESPPPDGVNQSLIILLLLLLLCARI